MGCTSAPANPLLMPTCYSRLLLFFGRFQDVRRLAPLAAAARHAGVGGLLILLVLAGSGMRPAQAQSLAPPWELAVAFGRNQSPYIEALTTDAAGNVYVGGFFYDSLRLGNQLLHSAGMRDGFVAKWNATTTHFEWAQQVAGPEEEIVTAIATADSSVYITGVFYSASVSVGSLPQAAHSGTGNYNAFVAKLTATRAGPVTTWVQLLGGSGALVNTLAVAAHNVYVGGACYGPLTFGHSQLPDHYGLQGLNAFVAKLTDTGPSARCEWAHPAGTGISALAMGEQGLFLAGFYRGVPNELGPEALPNYGYGSSNIYVAKLIDTGAEGQLSWVQHTGDVELAWVGGLAVRGSSVYIGGSFFSKTLRFGATVLTNARHGGGTDIFVAKLTDTGAAGSFTWAQRIGGQGYDVCHGLAVNETGLYLAGEFSQPLDCGSWHLASAGGEDLLVTKLLDAGPTATFAWAQSLGSPANDAAWAIALSGPRVYVAGHLVTPVRVGAGPLVENSFIGRLRDPGAGPASRTPIALELYPNPAQGSVGVRLPPLPGVAQATLTLRDVQGRVVRQTTEVLSAAGLRYSWPLPALPGGVYMLQVQAGTTSLNRRLVVE